LVDAAGKIDAYLREQKFFGSFFKKGTASRAILSLEACQPVQADTLADGLKLGWG